MATNYATNYLKKNASVLKIASNLDIDTWNVASESGANNHETYIDTGEILQRNDPFLSAAADDNDEDDDDDDINNTDDDETGASKMAFKSTYQQSRSKPFTGRVDSSSRATGSRMHGKNWQIGATSRLDAIPSQYRRGYSNLNDLVCSTKPNSKYSGLRAESMNNAAPLDYGPACDSVVDQTKIIRMENHGETELPTIDGYHHAPISFNLDNMNDQNDLLEPNDIQDTIQDWEFSLNDQPGIGAEEDLSDDYSYSNLGYDNTYGTVNHSLDDYQSSESLFNINFDAIDDEVFKIGTMRLFENDLSAPNAEFMLNEKCTIYDRPFANENAATAIHIDEDNDHHDGDATHYAAAVKSAGSQEFLSENRNICTRTDIDERIQSPITVVPLYQYNLDDLMESNVAPLEHHESIVKMSSIVCINDNVDANPSTKTVENVGNSDESTPKPGKMRCAECNKKLGLIMIMKCHCERIFCAQHRYAEAHRCSYDFKAEGQRIIARENPLIVASKLPKM